MPLVTANELLEVIRILVNPPWSREVKGLTASEVYDIYGGTLLDALNTRDPEELVQEYRVWRSKHPNGLESKEENDMVKTYCDKCGKEIKKVDPLCHSTVDDDVVNGSDTFFTIRVHKRATRTHDTGNKNVSVDSYDYFNYSIPDLCPECMREISNAVKTVWDGKRSRTIGEIYGMIFDDKNKKNS